MVVFTYHRISCSLDRQGSERGRGLTKVKQHRSLDRPSRCGRGYFKLPGAPGPVGTGHQELSARPAAVGKAGALAAGPPRPLVLAHPIPSCRSPFLPSRPMQDQQQVNRCHLLHTKHFVQTHKYNISFGLPPNPMIIMNISV